VVLEQGPTEGGVIKSITRTVNKVKRVGMCPPTGLGEALRHTHRPTVDGVVI
jgi:hypothetical protein